MEVQIKRQFAALSDAIREGAKRRPQGFRRLFSGGRSCAWGAAMEAMGLGRVDQSNQWSTIDYIETLFPYLHRFESSACPEGGNSDCSGPFSLSQTIIHLNDSHGWTREEIADWLQEQEDKLGYETVIDTNEPVTREFRDSVVSEDCQASNFNSVSCSKEHAAVS